jgi:PRTRC genetic system protein B
MNEKASLKYVMNIYAKETGISGSVDCGHTVYAEAAIVDNGIVTSFVPLSEEAFKNMFALAHETKRQQFSKNLLDPGVLSFSDRIEDQHVLWYREARIRKILTSKTIYEIYLPAMLFYARGDELNIYALKSNSRPKASTKLFYAPLKNLSGDNTRFCWGSVMPNITSPIINEIISQWEKYIWVSYFNNDGADMVKCRKIYNLYKKLHKSKAKFPKRELIPLNKTLKEIFHEMA